MTVLRLSLAGISTFVLGVGSAQAEPEFLSKQYARCSTCHFSPTGGGLLTPYGRSLSRNELSTTGRSAPGAAPGTSREHEFLGWGTSRRRAWAFGQGGSFPPTEFASPTTPR